MSAKAVRYLVAGALLSVIIAVLAATLFTRAVRHGKPDSAPARTAAAINDPFPTTLQLPDLNGRMQRFSQWNGKLLLVNFWATWCVPCRQEIPTLTADQRQYRSQGLQIVGLAVDEAKTVREKAPHFGFDYPILVGSLDPMIVLMARLGNQPGGLPFSVLVDAHGQIVHRQLGAFEPKALDRLIRDHLPDRADLTESSP